MAALFRSESIEHSTRRLAGDVLLRPTVSVWTYVAVFGTALLVAAVLLATTTYARKETVKGWLTPEGGVARATAARGGVLRGLYVDEGDSVEPGEPLAALSLMERSGDGDVGTVLVRQLTIQSEAATATADATLEALKIERDQLEQRRRSLRRELAGVREEMRLHTLRVSLASEDAKRVRALVQLGDASEALGKARIADYIDARRTLSSLGRSGGRIEREIGDVESQIKAIPQREALARSTAQSVTSGLGEKATRTGMEIEYRVASPIAGRVDVIVADVGESIHPGAPIAVIVRDEAVVVAELYVPSRAVGFLSEGQEVRLSYAAFPFQRFGSHMAVIEHISSTALTAGEVDLPGVDHMEPVFRVVSRLPSQTVSAYGELVRLRSGMLVTAEITIDRRTLVEWVLDPIFAAVRP